MSEIVVVPKRKRYRLWLWLIAIVTLLFVCAIIGISVFVGWSLTHPQKAEINETPAKYGMTFNNVSFVSQKDQLKLKGWFIPAVNEPKQTTLIVAHGYKMNRQQSDVPVLKLARQLTERGYHMLLFDFRNAGESEGDLTSVGQFEKYDLLAAIEWVKQNQAGKVGLIGYSMGGATSLLAAAEAKDVIGVVSDSAFSNLTDYLRDNLSVWSNLPNFPFTPLILAFIPPATGTDPDQVNPLESAKKISPRPILFIHGKGDKSIPYQNSVRMAALNPQMFQLWLTEGAGHVGSYAAYPEQYVDKVDIFFQHAREEQP